MTDQKRGDDAADHAPKPKHGEAQERKDRKQDAPNFNKRADEGRAIERENVSSANDE